MDRLVIGCGYVGKRVARAWQAQGGRVYATTRRRERAEEFQAAGLVPILCDVLDPDSLVNLPRVHTVLYAVGMDRAAGRSLREVYVEGLRQVLAHLPLPERFLYISSTSPYGQTAGEEVDESAPTEPVDQSGHVVLAAERLLREKLPGAIILRFSGIYGPDRLLRRRLLEAGQPLVGDPEKWVNLIHIEDGVAAILAAEERGRPGETYNISDDTPCRRGDFYAALAAKLGAPEPRWIPPEAEGTVPGPELVNRRIINRKAKAALGWTPRYPSFREGLASLL